MQSTNSLPGAQPAHRRASRSLTVAALTVLASAGIAASPLAASARTTASGPRATASRVMPRSLTRAASRRARADRLLVTDAKALKQCVSRHPARCASERRAVQQAGSRLALASQALAKAARSNRGAASARYRMALLAPQLSVSGQTLKWARVAWVTTYVVETKVPGQPTSYALVKGTSVTPPPVPGATVAYRIRTALSGSSWSATVSISYPRPAEAEGGSPTEPTPPVETVDTQAAPVLTVSGQILRWNQVGGVSTYVLMQHAAGQAAQYTVLSGTSFTPTPAAGATVYYSIRTAVNGSAWAPEVSITYPAAPVEPTPPVTPPASGVIIGTNDALGWGPEVAKKTFAAGLRSARIEAGAGLNTPQHAREEGFTNNIVIVGNTPDGSRLATVETASWTTKALAEVKEAAANGDTLMEVGNEMFLKGGQAEPVKYAEMYVSLDNAVKAAGVTGVKLLFNDYGDYDPNGVWSLVQYGGGWLGDALRAQPTLKTIVAGFTNHPYGKPGENQEDNWGPGALVAEHNQAVSLGFANTDFYVSEFGVRAEAGGATGSASPAQQAELVRAVYTELIATGYVKGIWFYESHDESSTAKWGFVSGSWSPRPVLGVLEEIAKKENA